MYKFKFIIFVFYSIFLYNHWVTKNILYNIVYGFFLVLNEVIQLILVKLHAHNSLCRLLISGTLLWCQSLSWHITMKTKNTCVWISSHPFVKINGYSLKLSSNQRYNFIISTITLYLTSIAIRYHCQIIYNANYYCIANAVLLPHFVLRVVSNCWTSKVL